MKQDDKAFIIDNYRELLVQHKNGAATSQSSVEGQLKRFEQIVRIADLNHRSILDIGCNTGCLYEFLNQHVSDFLYTGIDLVPEMIVEAIARYPQAQFLCKDLLSDTHDEQYDYVLMSMLFNNDFVGVNDFFYAMLKKAFALCEHGMAFNFLSKQANFFDAGLAYYDPTAVFEFCRKELSSKVDIRHHYFRCDVSVFVYKK